MAALLAQNVCGQSDWPAYGNDPGSMRYSSLAQINTVNVSKLAQVWAYNTKPTPGAKVLRPL
ncbi:MAG: hypothetical protein ACRD4C_08125 [Candidatus Acidiferrales bacterium]